MVPKFRSAVTALALLSTMPAVAQQSPAPPTISSTPNAQSPEVPRSDQAQATKEQQPPAGKAPVLKPTKAPEDQNPSGNATKNGDGIRVVHGDPESPEALTAKFTFWLVIATALLGVGTFGLALSTRGLHKQTKRLADQAVIASEDAKTSIEIATQAANASATSAEATVRAAEAAMRQAEADRPWILFDRIDCGPAQDILMKDGRRANGIGLIVYFKNAGRTPAILSKMNIDSCVAPNENEDPDFRDLVRDNEASLIISPEGTFNTAPIFFLNEDAAAIASQTHAGCVFAEIVYRSVYAEQDFKSVFTLGIYKQSGQVKGSDGRQFEYLSKLIGKRNQIV